MADFAEDFFHQIFHGGDAGGDILGNGFTVAVLGIFQLFDIAD